MKINDMNVQSEADILQVLAEVEAGNEEFALLERDKLIFMQTSSGELEYRSGQEHYRAVEAPVAPDKIRAAFLSYYRGDREYLANFHWELVTHKSLWDTVKGWFGQN